jgi:hypothetical protein
MHAPTTADVFDPSMSATFGQWNYEIWQNLLKLSSQPVHIGYEIYINTNAAVIGITSS